MTTVVPSAGARAHPRARSRAALVRAAESAERRGEFPRAREEYECALRLPDQSGQGASASSLLRWIGRTHLGEGDLDAALDCLAAAHAVANAHDDDAARAHALNLTAITRQRRGDLEEAELLYARALAGARAAGEGQLAAMIEQNRGTIANIRGDLHAALRRYRASLRRYQSLGLTQYVGPLLNNLGMVYTDLRRWAQAERAFVDALEHCVASDDRHAQIMVQVNRVELWIARRQFDRARVACDAARALATRLRAHHALGEIEKHYGVIARETGDFPRAESRLGEAARIASERQDPLLAAEVARELADLYWRQERHRETLQALNQAHAIFTRLRASLELADVARRMSRLEDMFLVIVRRWGESIETKDHYTQGHCRRVADYACALAADAGLDAHTLFWFRMGALLHDVGKIEVPDEILNKPGRLTDEERKVIERHPVTGESMLAGIEFPWDIRPMVRHHHERFGGGGYPDGIAGEAIPLSARILTVADIYDALTSARSYRSAHPHERAMQIMHEEVGNTLDPELFARFERLEIRCDRGGPVWPAPEEEEPQRAAS